MKVTYDAESRAAYIYLSGDEDDTISRTQEVSSHVLADLDTHGRVMGVELLDVDMPTVEDITGCAASPTPDTGEVEP